MKQNKIKDRNKHQHSQQNSKNSLVGNEQEKVIHYYNRVSKIYDASYESAYWKIYHRITWENIRRHLPRDMSVKILDIGGGTGLWAIKIAKTGYHVVLADISPGMLDTAQKKCSAENLLDKISFVQADICDMKEFEPASFDFVLCQGDPISCCGKPRKAIQEIFRVMRPGAKAICSVDNKFGAMHYLLEQNRLDELENFLHTGWSTWITEAEHEQFQVKFFSPDEIQELFCSAGFTVLSMMGKTVIPWRRYPTILDNKEQLDQIVKLELSLNQEPHLLGSSAHLEFVVQK